jgi:uncharacterized protein
MARFKDRYGPWAIVTGASSGIGEQFARELAERGVNLVLVARREPRLRELAGQLRERASIETREVAADLASEDFMPVIERATGDLEIGLLVNNAGFATTGAFLGNDLSREVEMLHLNCRAPVILAHHFGRKMRDRGSGGIIFLGSVVGFTAMPVWSHYAATKGFDILLAEGLASELKPHGVDVMALCPGTTRTGFQEVSGTNDFLAMRPEDVAVAGLDKLGKRTTVVPGIVNKLNAFSTRLMPRSWSRAVFGRVIRHMSDSA